MLPLHRRDKDLKFYLLKYLLKWFCEKELDQWERWKVNTKYGQVFITISRIKDGCEHYDQIS